MKALIAMSGGVDSSVAALLAVKAGYDCVGCTMKLFEAPEDAPAADRACCTLEDAEDARRCAAALGIPFYVFNFKDAFKENVIKRFCGAYLSGETPNPCIDCNKYMKFGKLFERASVLGCEYVVTGHYARIERENGAFILKKGLDPKKDQSYVLYSMTQQQLAHTLFPLGALNKSEVRVIAKNAGFSTAGKADSQDICFVRDKDYAAAVERYSGIRSLPGDFTDCTGVKLGSHKGIIRYTVGQRKGLGIPSDFPLYVCGIDPSENTVTLGTEEELMTDRAEVKDFNWISGTAPTGVVSCRVKVRYRQPEQDAEVYPTGPDSVSIRFAAPQRAVTPGQSAVLYSGDTVLGGGIIKRSGRLFKMRDTL